MKGDMNELKKLVLQILKDETSSHEIIKQNEQLFSSIQAKSDSFTQHETNPVDDSVTINSDKERPAYELERIEDISHETEEDDSLSIEKKEKELIIKALRKNRNKRKYAAQDLGISERTLYRKIKQYELEN
jgi:transcriptional regulator of acetoin/glycerol metabolism